MPRSTPLRVVNSRGEPLDILADLPDGPGPHAALVLAPGNRVPMSAALFEQVAHACIRHGIAVFRFNWAHLTTPETRSHARRSRVAHAALSQGAPGCEDRRRLVRAGRQ